MNSETRIPRKPVNAAHLNSEPKSPEYSHWESASSSQNGNNTDHYPPYTPKREFAPTTFNPHTPRSRLQTVRTKITTLPRRTKILLATALLCLLILIIGLAAGLSTRSKTQNLPLPTNNGGPWKGELTYYDPGLGACGIDSHDGDHIVAVSHFIFDAVSTGSNPNANPLCGKMIRARRDGKSVDLKVVDRCTGCQPRDLDITLKVFAGLAAVERGRVDVEWSWLEGVPGAAG